MAISEKATVEVQINGEQAKNELRTLEGTATRLKSQINEAYAAGDKNKMKILQKELSNVNREINKMRSNSVSINEAMNNLSSKGPKELQKMIKAINSELNSGRVKRGSEEWKLYQERLRLVNSELRKIKMESKDTESWFSRMNSKFNNWGSTIMAVAASLTGVTLAFNSMRKNRDEKESSAANLKALTGLDDSSIQWLTKQAEILSTNMTESKVRIQASSKDILEAYMLVGSAKPDLLQNKEALNEVTYQALELATAAKMEVKDAVDGVTLAMNQYSAEANEAARYTNVLAAGSKFGSANVQQQTEAIIKSGVAASGANVQIEELSGMIETLAEKGIKGEIAGTGLKNVLLKLEGGAKETRPSVVGLETSLQRLKASTLDATEMQKMFGLENYSVAKALIDNADKVKYYSQAVTDTSIATEQAVINSATNEAKMAQSINKVKESGIELINQLSSSISILVGWGTKVITALPIIIRWIMEHKSTLVSLVSVVSTYIIATKLAVLWETKLMQAKLANIAVAKLKVFWTNAIKAAEYAAMGVQTLFANGMGTLSARIIFSKQCFQALFTTLKLNPFGAVLAIITAIGIAIYKFATYTSDADKAMKEFNKENIKEQSELQKLKTAIDNSNVGTQQRAELIKEFNQKYGVYLSNLLTEKSTVQDVAKAYREAASAIQNKLAIQHIEKSKEDITSKSLQKRGDAMQQVQEALSEALPISVADKVRSSILDYVNNAIGNGKSVEAVVSGVSHGIFKSYKQITEDQQTEINKGVRDYAKVLADDMKQINEINKKFSSLITKPKEKPKNQLDEVVVTPDRKDKSIDSKDVKYKDNPQVVAENKRYYDELLKLKEKYLSDDKMTSEQYQRESENLEMSHLDELLKIANLEPEKRQEIEQKLYDVKIKFREQLKSILKAQEEEERKDYEKYQEDNYTAQNKAYQLKIYDATSNHYLMHTSEQEYYNKLIEIQDEYYNNMLNNVDISEKRKTEILDEQNKLRLQQQKKDYEKQEKEEKKNIDNKKQLFLTLQSSAEEAGSLIAEFLTSTDVTLKDFAKGMVKLMLDTLEKILVGAIAERTIKNIAILGPFGIAKSVGEIALMTAAFETAKAVLGNFYTGGYTGSGAWDEPKGYVHSNEFVANRFAVSNPNVRPVLDLINSAQKNNTIGSITSEDISKVISTPGKQIQETVNHSFDNSQLISLISNNITVIKELRNKLKEPIFTYTKATGKFGINEAIDLLEKMNNNTKRRTR